jgi:class I fructose-bisphosphate aldolase
VGRNLWGHGDPTVAARAFKSVIHDRTEPEQALAAATG